MRNILIPVIIMLLLGLIVAPTSFAQEKQKKITYKEYEALLAEWQTRLANAETAISIEDSLIKDLKEKYKMTDEEIAQIQQEIYDMLGVFEADVENFDNEMAALENQIKTLRALTPELLYQRQDEIESAENKVNQLKSQSLSNIPANWDRLEKMSSDIEDLKARVPKPKNDIYVVMSGDNLWKISSKADIYNDPYKWPRIWSANVEIVKDPNMIYPDQNLTIIRELDKNQHLVARGECLRDISAKQGVYGDPFQWTKIYEANKAQIEDPNLIYPEQILTIPGK
jgi:nucleoid-associated protein YgaU